MRTAAALLCAALLGCASAPPPPPAAPERAQPEAAVAPPVTVRIVEPAFGRERSKKAEPMLVPFGVNQNGTVLILALIERAWQQGARYVGDLQLVWTFRLGGTAVECRSKVLFEGDPALHRPAAPAARAADATPDPYGTEVEKFRPRRLSVTAKERELFCTEGTRQVVKRVAAAPVDLTSAENGRRMDRPRGSSSRVERVVTAERRDRCVLKDVTRRAERYDYEIKLGFVPPNWDYISSRYADRRLVQEPPACYRIDDAEVGKGPIYRLTATAYYQGEVAQRLPETPPSMETIDNMNRPEGPQTPGAKLQRCKALGRKDCDAAMDDPFDTGNFRPH